MSNDPYLRDRLEPCLQELHVTTIMITPAIKQCYKLADKQELGSKEQLNLRSMAQKLNSIKREIDKLTKFLAEIRQ
jgi:hypothetical protein